MRELPVGTHMLLVRSVGFEPVSDVVELTDLDAQHVSVALITPARVMSPVVIEARRLAAAYARVGFDRRQQGGVGQFLTADDIAARHAEALSQLFEGMPGLTNVLPIRDSQTRERSRCWLLSRVRGRWADARSRRR